MANPSLNRSIEGYSNGSYNGYGAVAQNDVVTLDGVVQKTVATVGLLVVTAVLSWVYLNNAISNGDANALAKIGPIMLVASLGAVGLSFAISFMKKVSVPLILLFAALEGAVIGVYSKFATIYAGSNEPVVGAVVGTFAAFAGTLAVYKFFNIQVTSKMRKAVNIAVLAFVGVSLLDLGLYFFGASIGVNEFGPVGVIASFVGIGIALFMLLTDFDAVERAIEYRLPAIEGWRLAFGLTVTLVWLYVNMLKILSYFQHD